MPFLGFILAFILWTIAAVLGIVLLFLVLPVSVRGKGRFWLSEEGDPSSGWDLDGGIGVLAGALGADGSRGDGVKIRVLGLRFSAGKGTHKPRTKAGDAVTQEPRSEPKARAEVPGADSSEPKPKSKRMPKLGLSGLKEWLRAPVRRRGIRCFRRMLGAVKRQARVSVRCGLPDPWETGMATAAYATWAGASGQEWLQFNPCFTEVVLDVEIRGAVRLSLGRMLWIAGSFLLSRDVRPLWWKKGTGKKTKAPVVQAQQTG